MPLGTGASLSNGFGGRVAQRAGFSASFLALGAVACVAFLLLLAMPETRRAEPERSAV